MHPVEALLGSKVGDGVRLVGVLGTAPRGVVYEAADRGGESVCVTVFRRTFGAEDEEPLRRMLRETRAAAALHLPNAAVIYDAGVLPDGRPWIVQERVLGPSFAQLLASGRPVAPPRVAELLSGVARALDGAHRAGIVHGALEPEVVVLAVAAEDGGEVAKVLDLGTAALGRSDDLVHVAPEVLSEGAPTPEGDVYALAVLAFRLLAGVPPFGPRHPRREGEAPSLALRSGLHFGRELESVVARGLAPEPTARPWPATELVRELRAAAARASVAPPQHTASDPTSPRAMPPRTLQGVGRRGSSTSVPRVERPPALSSSPPPRSSHARPATTPARPPPAPPAPGRRPPSKPALPVVTRPARPLPEATSPPDTVEAPLPPELLELTAALDDAEVPPPPAPAASPAPPPPPSDVVVLPPSRQVGLPASEAPAVPAPPAPAAPLPPPPPAPFVPPVPAPAPAAPEATLVDPFATAPPAGPPAAAMPHPGTTAGLDGAPDSWAPRPRARGRGFVVALGLVLVVLGLGIIGVVLWLATLGPEPLAQPPSPDAAVAVAVAVAAPSPPPPSQPTPGEPPPAQPDPAGAPSGGIPPVPVPPRAPVAPAAPEPVAPAAPEPVAPAAPEPVAPAAPARSPTVSPPSDGDALAQATRALEEGRARQAERLFRLVLRETPGSAAAWRGLAQANERLVRRRKAIWAYQQFLRRSPSASEAAEARERIERLEEAQARGGRGN